MSSQAPRFHNALSRRQILSRLAVGGMTSFLGGSAWTRQLASAADVHHGQSESPDPDRKSRRHKSCIVLWMSGGPSQMETLDPKPGHRNGGPTRSIQTSVPGISIADNLPGVAKHADKLAIIRSMQTKEGDHGRATQLMTSGRVPGGMGGDPHLGSLIAHRLHQPTSDLPPFVSIAPPAFGRIGPGYLGPKYAPLVVSGESADANTRSNLTIENLAPQGEAGDLQRRFDLLRRFQAASHTGAADHAPLPTHMPSVTAYQATYDSAMRMVETGGGGAFDLDQEDDTLRDAYGRNRFGQGCLLARRLVERGVPFVEVSLFAAAGGVSWDSHSDNFKTVSTLCETLDPAWSTLLTDLKQRGLLEDTLVVWMGEFGRTPRINANGGRDHFPDAWSMAMAGANVRGGQVIGKTSDDGMRVTDRPVGAGDLFATMLQSIDISPFGENMNGDRPMPLVADEASVIKEVIRG